MPPAAFKCRTSTPVVGVAATSASITSRPTAASPPAMRRGQHRPRRPAIARQHQAAGRQFGRQGAGVANRNFGREALAHDACATQRR